MRTGNAYFQVGTVFEQSFLMPRFLMPNELAVAEFLLTAIPGNPRVTDFASSRTRRQRRVRGETSTATRSMAGNFAWTLLIMTEPQG